MLFLAGVLAIFQANRWLSAVSPPGTDPTKSALSLQTPGPPRDEGPAEPFKRAALAAILLGVAGFAAIIGSLALTIARLMPRALAASGPDEQPGTRLTSYRDPDG